MSDKDQLGEVWMQQLSNELFNEAVSMGEGILVSSLAMVTGDSMCRKLAAAYERKSFPPFFELEETCQLCSFSPVGFLPSEP